MNKTGSITAEAVASADDNKVKCWIVVMPEEYSEYKIGDYYEH